MILRNAKVTKVARKWNGSGEVNVTVIDAPDKATDILPGAKLTALYFTHIVGEVFAGDTVRIECSPVAKNLGTGGYAMVTATLNSLPSDTMPPDDGHVVKARYTPSQVMVASVDEQQSPHHDVMAAATTLDAAPVIATDLHSAVPAIVAGIRAVDPDLTIAYVYTDGAALPAWFSMALSTLRQQDWISAVITADQAVGGDYEAASLPSALLAARHVAHADIIIACQGPGNLGTGTPYGFSGVNVAWALTVASRLGGTPIAALRVSASDKRERHLGISHHSIRVLHDLTALPVTIIQPLFDQEALTGNAVDDAIKDVDTFNSLISDQVTQINSADIHHRVIIRDIDSVREQLATCPVRLSTMGRTMDDDATPFLAAAVAGAYAAEHITDTQD